MQINLTREQPHNVHFFFNDTPTPKIYTLSLHDALPISPGGPGQRFPFTIPNPQTINWAQLQPIASSPGFDLSNRLPYSQHYDFSIQREFGGSTLLTLAYVGTNGHHLIAGYASNPGIAAVCLAA